MKYKQTLAALLILSVTFSIGFSRAQAQTEYNLNLQTFTWNHSTISVLVVPEENAQWWQPSYVNATLRAIGEWNNAIHAFALNYSSFAYVSNIRMIPTVAATQRYGFDVYVSWAKTLVNRPDAAGLTTNMYSSSGIMMNSTIALAAEGQFGYVQSEVDMQNVALHELGHSFGLGHSNYSGDIMYPSVTIGEPVKGVSTLDVYGVSRVFQWMSSSRNAPYRPQQSSVTLPSSIEYLIFPVSYENLPPQTVSPYPPQNLPAWSQAILALGQILLAYVLQFLLHPLILISLLVAIAALVATKFIVARASHKNARTEPPDQIPE